MEVLTVGWTRPRPSPLTMPELPQNIDLPDSIQGAARRAVEHGGIGALVGIGLLVRFGVPRVEDLLTGADTARAWVQSAIADLDEDAARAGSHLASTAAVAFAQTIRRLDDDIDPESAGWRADLIDSLRQRDDLCSAVRVLRALHIADELDAILAQADSWTVTWLDSLPFSPSLDDEHLVEVALRENPYWARRAWVGES